MNTPETSPTGNIHGMPLAVALGLGEPSLVGPGRRARRWWTGARAAVVGLRDVDVAERANLKRVGHRRLHHARHRRARDAHGDGGGDQARHQRHRRHPRQLRPRRRWTPSSRPGVGTPSPGGLSYREAHLAMEMLADTGKVLSAELVEVNPILDQRNRPPAGVELLASLLGKKIL